MDQAQSFDPNEPWDVASAEALTRLYESDDGNLRRPATRERAPRTESHGGYTSGASSRSETDGIDRTWLEAHLSRLAKRLQRSLTQSTPERSLAALSDRLDAIEQRFGDALGRVAQRTDLDSLKSIEREVMALAAQLAEARDRLDRIGAVDEEVRALAQRLDEAGERRAGALEKLLRDCIAEWRAGEERTASALHNLEEAIGRLGDSVADMEAAKPAPELTVPALARRDLDPPDVPADHLSRLHVGSELARTVHIFHSTLDAADYAPKPPMDGVSRGEEPALAIPTRVLATQPAAAQHAGHAAGGGERVILTAGSWEIADVRARLRQEPGAAFQAMHPEPGADAGRPEADGARRASLGLLLAAGAAVLASSTYLLYQAVVAPILPTARPAATEPGAQAVGSEPELPGERRG